jgi:MFS family permease
MSEPAAPRGLRRTFQSLGTRNYRLFFVGQVVSITGTWMQRIAQDWLILQLGGGPRELAIGLALQSVPYVTVGLWGGALTDRFSSRRLFLLSQVLQCLVSVVLGALVLTDKVTLTTVFAFSLAVGCIGVIESPSRQTFVLDIVRREHAANAVSLNSSINNVARLAGPAIAGGVIGIAGTGVAYLANAATFVGIIVATILIKPDGPREPDVPRPKNWQVLEGLRRSWQTPLIRRTLTATFLVSAFAQNFRIVLPLFATGVFAGGSGSYGLLMSAVAVGAIAGGILCAHLARPSLRLLALCSLALGLVLVVASVAPRYLVLLVLMAGAGVGNTSFNTTSHSLVLLNADPTMRGRFVSVRTIVSNGSTFLGSLGIGLVCEWAGPRVGMAIGGVVACLTAALLVRQTRASRPAHEPSAPGPLPAPSPDPSPDPARGAPE